MKTPAEKRMSHSGVPRKLLHPSTNVLKDSHTGSRCRKCALKGVLVGFLFQKSALLHCSSCINWDIAYSLFNSVDMSSGKNSSLKLIWKQAMFIVLLCSCLRSCAADYHTSDCTWRHHHNSIIAAWPPRCFIAWLLMALIENFLWLVWCASAFGQWQTY